MKTVTKLLFALLVLSVFLLPGIVMTKDGTEAGKTRDAPAETRDVYIPPAHNLDVPYYPQENSQSTGMAALECVFDFYGEHVPQSEISDVIGPLIGYSEPDEEEMARAGQFSNLSTAKNNQNLDGYSVRGLGYAAFYYNWGNRPPNPSPNYFNRKMDLIRCVANKTPVIVWTNVNESLYTGKVWRVVKGYSDAEGAFILHDLTTGGASEYGGKDVKIGYGKFLNKIWNTSGGDSIGVVVQPWSVKVDLPIAVLAGQVFEIEAEGLYPVQVPMQGTQYPVTDCYFYIDLPSDYKLVNDTYARQSTIRNGGSSETIVWKVQAPDKGNGRKDMIYVNVTARVSGRTGVISYTDKIGYGGFANVSVSGLVNHEPVIYNATADPASIPNDGKTTTLISARVIDVDNNLQDVVIDLSKIGRSKNQRMYDDGSHGDLFAGDSVYSIMESAPSSAVTGDKKLEITATDSMGRYGTGEVALEVTDAVAPPPEPGDPPVMTDFFADPSSAPNDGTTLVLFTVSVTDPDGDLSSVTLDLSPLGGEAATPMYDDGTFGDPAANDGYYSYETFVDTDVTEGKKTITAQARDKKGNKVNTTTEFTVTTKNLKPDASDPEADPKEVPNDSTTQVLLKVKATDPNNNLKSVVISLTPIGGVASQKMFDDGSNGDQKKGDDIFTFRTVVPSTVSVGQKDLKITATDTEGLTDTEHIFLKVVDFNSPPEVSGPASSQDSVDNDNKTYVVFTVKVTDPDNNLDTVTIDLSKLGGKSAAVMYDDGENGGDETAGDDIYSARSKVSLKTSPGNKNLTITAKDNKGAKATTVVSIDVTQRPEEEENGTPGFTVFAALGGLVLASGAVAAIRGRKRTRR